MSAKTDHAATVVAVIQRVRAIIRQHARVGRAETSQQDQKQQSLFQVHRPICPLVTSTTAAGSTFAAASAFTSFVDV